MDLGYFDDLTRAMAGGAGPRRAALRLLTGITLAGLAARLGLGDTVESKRRHQDKKSEKSGSRTHVDQAHAAAKHKKKQKQKKSKQKKPKPPPSCAAGTYPCDDGSCVGPDQCCSNEVKCPEGCVKDHCCIGENECKDGSCLPGGECCPEERACSDGWCASGGACCLDEQRCGGNCIPADLCCDDNPNPLCSECEEIACKNGSKVCRSTCQYEDSVCCKGECLLPCSGGQEINPRTCQCECPSGWRLLMDRVTCCPDRRACGLGHDAEGFHNTVCCDVGQVCHVASWQCGPDD